MSGTSYFILYVADQSRATAFYSAVLAVAPRLDTPGHDRFQLAGRCGIRPDGHVLAFAIEAAADAASPFAQTELERQTSQTLPEARQMITEYVLFDLPRGISREEVVAGMHEVAPRWQKEPNLIRKTFVFDEQAHQAGAFYLWADRASAEAAHDEAWRQRIRATYRSEPVIRYFDTPLVVDNALGKLVE